jgi:endoglucanase
MDFTHQGADWIDPMYPLGRVYGNQWDKQALIDDPAKVVAFAKRTGKVPFMGETGAYNLIPDSQRAAYHKAVYTAFSRVGVNVCVWAYTNTFPSGITIRASGTPACFRRSG